MPLRVAMPNKVMKPMMAGMLTVFEERNIANTPPINANGRLMSVSADNVTSLNSPYKRRNITKIAMIVMMSNVRDAFFALWNCPPYSTK